MKSYGLLSIIFMLFILTGCTANEAANTEAIDDEEKTAQRKSLTKEEVEELSLQSLQIIQRLASSGGASEEQQKVKELINRLNQYKDENNSLNDYSKNLKNCLLALMDYSAGNADEKALGKAYPDYKAAVERLKQEEPGIELSEPTQYDWFYAAASVYERGRKKDGEITLTFVGDNSFGTYPETPEHLKFDHVFKANGGDNHYVFKNSLPWFNSDDFTIINAESAFTNETKAENKMWRIKSNPAHVAFLPASGVEAANLANNHTKDYFLTGYEDTLEAFAENNVAVFNDGMPLKEKIGKIETIFLGYDCRMSQQSPEFLARIVEEVKTYKRKDNLVIVNMHWGVEYRETPVYYQTQFGRSILDAGADIIMGGHPHRLESIENYNGKYIIYSMGDYAFGADPTLHSRQTAMFRLRFAKENDTVVMKGLTIVPTLENSDGSTSENNYQPLPVFGKEAEDIINELITISSPIENGVTEYDYFDPFL
ncbi:CapA family protein [Niallia endozanthoxylica]|uniref:CapA family protein n=1 Tax=Niallia endozanthoxylica TaxID=2036016 RepID=A0A5J5H2L2_9BACI|nr:CapA family protein [Niallia endozanthoxylica]KAA9014527.1 CapA family protein [Niallia endozanthoxylica]